MGADYYFENMFNAGHRERVLLQTVLSILNIDVRYLDSKWQYAIANDWSTQNFKSEDDAITAAITMLKHRLDKV